MSANLGYYLVDGSCKPYSVKATYLNYNDNEEVQLINDSYYFYIDRIFMNNTKIDKTDKYNFSSIGNLTFYFHMNISLLNSIKGKLYQLTNMLSIDFTTEFNTKNIHEMDYLFYESIL